MKNKLFTLLFAILAGVGTMFAENGTCGVDLTWNLSGSTLTISGTGDMDNYSLLGTQTTAPWGSYKESIEFVIVENGVTHIGNYAFYSFSNLKSAQLSNTVKSIGYFTFSGCENLTSINFPNSLTNIVASAFSGCLSLKSVSLPNSITSLGSGAFGGCKELVSANIPSTLTTISDQLFLSCHKLSSIEIPDGVTQIGVSAFEGCSSLTSIVIPDKVKKIGMSAFSKCTGLTSVTIGKGVETMESYAFHECTGLTGVYISDIAAWCSINQEWYNESTILLYAHNIYLNGNLVTDLVIPDGVTKIKKRAFHGCSSITSVSLPASVDTLEIWAFADCKNLSSISISNVNYIGQQAFAYNPSLTSVEVPSCVKYLGWGAFWNCAALKEVKLNNGLEEICGNAFNNTAIEEITIPETVKRIEDYVFSDNNNLKSITWNAINCSSSTQYPLSNYCPSITFGDKVEVIPAYLCVHNTGETTQLPTIVLPNSVKEIKEHAFFNCEKAQFIKIGNQVEKIGKRAFWNCSGAQYISCTTITPPICEEKVFLNIDKSIPLYVPEESIEAYKEADQWKDFTNIRPLVDIFHVTFVGWDGKQLKSQYIEIGQAATAPNAPQRTGYTFTSWDMDFSNVTADMTVTAQYKINRYEVIFQDWDGTILKSDSVDWNSAATAPADPKREGYTFTGWNKDFSKITTNLTITAQYKINRYEVIFQDWDETVLKKDSVKYGSAAVAPSNPKREGYIFKGWDKDYSKITADLIVTAQYFKRYTVTFLDWDGTSLKTEQVEEGKSATAPSEPKREGYTFAGWDMDFSNVTADMTVTAQYKINRYEVKFLDWDDTILKSDSVDWYSAATAPSEPKRDGYTFAGWDKDFSNVKADMTVTAQYKINRYEVIFQDWDETVLKKDSVNYGEAATAPSNPEREEYDFIGWNKDFSAVIENMIITALYEEQDIVITRYILDMKVDGISIDDWTINDATINESTSDVSKGKYGFDTKATVQGVSYITNKSRFQFMYINSIDKTNAFYIYPGSCYESGGKNGLINIETEKDDTIKIEVAAKGSTAGSFKDPNDVYPINATVLSEDMTLPAKAKGSAGADNNGYTWKTLEFLSKGGDVTLKEFNGGFRIRKAEVVHVKVNTPTDLKSVDLNQDESVQKILRNGQILILRGEKMYTLQGQEVK